MIFCRRNLVFTSIGVKDPPSGLRQFLTTESPLKVMGNAFYFVLKAFSVLKIFKFLSWLFGHVGKRLHKKTKVNFKIYDATDWTANSSNTHIAQCRKKQRQSGSQIWIQQNTMWEIFLLKMRQGYYSQTSFCILKKLYLR